MNITLLIIGAIIIYIIDIFALTYFSGKFIGIQSFPIKDVGILGLAIILFSWLIGTAVVHVPLILKPYLLLFSLGVIIYFFILVLDTHYLKAIAAGMFFLLCQAVLIIVLLRQFWTKDLLDLVRFILFNL